MSKLVKVKLNDSTYYVREEAFCSTSFNSQVNLMNYAVIVLDKKGSLLKNDFGTLEAILDNFALTSMT